MEPVQAEQEQVRSKGKPVKVKQTKEKPVKDKPAKNKIDLLYIGVTLSDIEGIVDKIPIGSLTKKKEYHITLLYVGRKEHPDIAQFSQFLNKECTVICDGFGLTTDACCLSVKSVICEGQIVPSFTKQLHVTIALADGVKPASSVDAILGDNPIYPFENTDENGEIIINGFIREYNK
jgi:hypothetical protein